MKVSLVSPLHDPEARLLPYLQKYGKTLKQIYNDLVGISVTKSTSPKIIKALKKIKITFSIQKRINLGDNYRKAIGLGLEFQTPCIHLMDFDRALHWVRRFPNELREVVDELPSFAGFLSFVRTRRAFESHPLIQRSTETAINAIASEVAGMDVDIMSGSFGMDAEFARLICQKSKRKDFGIYAEFLEIALKNKIPIHTIKVEGLEWETPDQYRDKIKKEGYAAWLSEFESLPEWKKRVRLISSSTEVLTKKINPQVQKGE